jgi:hypothetical protein
MSDKVKPWHRRKPKFREQDERRKRVVPLRTGDDRRISPLRVDDSRVIPMTVDDYDMDDSFEE